MNEQPTVQFVTTFYPEFLKDYFAARSKLADQPYRQQFDALIAEKFSAVDAFCRELGACGCSTDLVILNADPVQERFAYEAGLALPDNIHDRRRMIFAEQVRRFRPDILYVFEWSPLGDDYLQAIKKEVKLLVGQVASPLRAERTYAAYDLMISSWPPIVEYFRSQGMGSEYIKLAFDETILDHVSSLRPIYDVSFVGGFAPSHPNRRDWLEEVTRGHPVEIFAYGTETLPQGSPLHGQAHLPVWGWEMYETLAQSRITLNMHAVNNIRGTVSTAYANNLRLFEATGMGALLLTDCKDNLAEMFEPGVEVVTYDDNEDCIAQIHHYLSDEVLRSSIAKAGQARTLRDHTYQKRMPELLDALMRHLRRVN